MLFYVNLRNREFAVVLKKTNKKNKNKNTSLCKFYFLIIYIRHMPNLPYPRHAPVFTYFLDSKAFASEYIGQYKLRKAYSFFGSGFVDKIYTRKIDKKILVRSSVTPSQTVSYTHLTLPTICSV